MIYSQEFFFSEEMFGMDRMPASLNRNSQDTPEMVLKNVCLAVDGFVGETGQFDDLTMLCIEYSGNGAALMVYTILFAQPGIPKEGLLLAAAMELIIDYVDTGFNVLFLLIETVDSAGRLGRLNRERLCRQTTT